MINRMKKSGEQGLLTPRGLRLPPGPGQAVSVKAGNQDQFVYELQRQQPKQKLWERWAGGRGFWD